MQTKKRGFSSEAAYVLGILTMALGTAMMASADFGMSMVVAPAYLTYLKLSQTLPFFTFGMAEYLLQALLLVALGCVLRRFRLSYLCSFVTAVLYGLALDGAMLLMSLLPQTREIWIRCVYYALGIYITTGGVAFLFHTYFMPEAYELFVKEISRHYGLDLYRFKRYYDYTSMAVSVALSFAFFGLGQFRGIHVGTLVSALLNGPLIALHSRILDGHLDFRDRLKLRRFFEGD